MSDLIVQGLMISVIGISLTFLALGILILVMVLLDHFFRDDKKVDAGQAEPVEQAASTLPTRQAADEEIVAAIAVALAQVRSFELCEAGLGSTLEAPSSRWWLVGRAQQSPADALRINHWRKG